MSNKSTLIKEIRVPLTHYAYNHPAEWVIGVHKEGDTYNIVTSEHEFCHVDEAIIQRIFEPIKHDLAQGFFNNFSMGSLIKDAEFLIGNGVYTSITGIKREGAAMATAYYLAEIVNRVLTDIPHDHLDRGMKHIKDNSQPPVYEWIDSYNKKTGLLEAQEGHTLTH